jgi:hypothetical protein
MYLEFSRSDDTYQKVVLAPLGEEPFKLFLAFVLLLSPIIFNKSKDTELPKMFLFFFVIFSAISGLLFGEFEGYLGNVLLHIAASSIGATLITFSYLKVKDRSWKTRYKLAMMYIPMILPMFIHSLGNQFMNISYANSHPEFNYLVTIARFLVENTFINDGFLFSQIMFVIALILIVIWYLYLYNHWKKTKTIF